MIYIIFSFDVEDYVNAPGADGILWSAEILRKAGVKGCFNIVSRLAEALVAWGRTDVLEALRYHEIDLHSYAHSFHPTINEYTDIADFDAAKAEFLRQETQGREIVSRIFHVDEFPAACPPGSSVSYVAHYGYADMNIPLYAGDFLKDPVRGRHIASCNITCLDYHLCLETFLMQSSREQIDARIEEIAAKKDMHVLYHHPQMAILEQFWDEMNFRGENTPPNKWTFSKAIPAEKTKKFYENFAYLVDKLKKDPRFQIVTYAEFARMHCKKERTICLEEIPQLKKQLQEYFFPVTEPDSYCISDIFLACRDLLLGSRTHVCEKVYGFLETPFSIEAAVELHAEDVRASAHAIGDGFLPKRIRVGKQQLGPADWLRAALEILCGAKKLVLQPAPWQIDMDQFPIIRDQDLKGSWIHSSTFEDRYLSDRSRLQSWTYRLPANTPRKIFE